MSRVLISGDTHFPACHPGYLPFLVDTYNKFNCDEFIHIGDVADKHMMSTHPKQMTALSPHDEIEEAAVGIRQLYETFPEGRVCIGNHDERIIHRAVDGNITERFLRPYAEAWDTPGWKWDESHIVDGVVYVHGTGNSGKYAAINLAIANSHSTVMGHTHSFPGILWTASRFKAWFGLNVGCGLDIKHYASRYGKHFKYKPVLGCGVVIDGVEAYFIKMPLGNKGIEATPSSY